MKHPVALLVACHALGCASPPAIAPTDASMDAASVPVDAATDAPAADREGASGDAQAPTGRWVTAPVDAPGVTQVRFMSAAARGPVTFHVYVPDAYATSTARFPVLYFLHGTGAGTMGVAPLSRHFGDAMRRGDLAPMLVVFPYGLESSLWVDDRSGGAPVEAVVVREIVPLVDGMFRTDARRERRIVEGFSMGGYGALRYGIVHPTVFGALSALAPGPLQTDLADGPPRTADARARLLAEVFGGDPGYFREVSPWVQAERHADTLRRGAPLQIVTGTADPQLPWVSAFHQHLVDLRVPHAYVEVPRVAHDILALLEALGPARWAFFSRALAQ